MAYTDIDKPSDYFETKLYVGNESTNAITGLDFQPDWVWLKNRDTAYYHGLYDSVRGTGNTKSLYSNAAEAEGQNPGNMNLASFNSDGFTLGATSSTNIINKSSQNHVSWNWLGANGTASNSNGSITSTVSANTTAGFSIVSYTGTGANATVGHGLSAVPSVIIIKNRDEGTGYNWRVYHHKNTSAPETDRLNLNDTNATHDDISYWNDTAPTSSVVSIGTDSSLNKSGDAHIAYCFAEKKGYSKFGSYTGNGNADGTFVYTGFKPAFVIAKETSEARDWQLWDNKRLGYNASGGNKNLIPNKTDAEDTYADIDILSNGFKLKSTSAAHNKSGQTYIYMAFAENPLVTSTGVPATAR